jgi:tmRNA-binding protein
MPLRLSFWRNHPNVEVGHARGKRQYGECQAVAEREMERAVRSD